MSDKIISAYYIESYRQVYEDNFEDFQNKKCDEPYVYYEQHEIRGLEEIDLSEWGFESKEDFLENFEDVKSDLYDVFDEASINLDDGSDIDEDLLYERDLDFDSSTAHHEDFNAYFSYEEAKEAFNRLVEQSRNFHKK